MIGNMIQKIRKEKGITKTKLSSLTDINIGHLTHIEKGERNPSHKALKGLCEALDVPYQPLMYTYDKENLENFIECPAEFSNASFAYKIPSKDMEPLLKEGNTVFIEQNAALEHKDIGLFFYNDSFYVRRLLYRRGKFILRADNKEIDDITVNSSDTFYIVGKIYL